MNLRIPLARPEVTDRDRDAVLDVLRTPELSMGPRLGEFEEAICAYLGSSFAVAVNSGTSALHLALRVLNLQPPAEVILPSFAFVAPLNVLLQEGLRPVFVEIDPATLNTTLEAVEAAITERTAAILAIHTFGRPVAVDRLRQLADQHGIFLIEDACEALGAELGGRKVGAYGHVGVLAFYPNKQITTGEGGLLLTDRRDWAERARRLRNQGRDPSLGWYQHAEVGYSYRLAEMNCALGREQLRRIDTTVDRRRTLAALYHRELEEVGTITRPTGEAENERISWFSYVIQLEARFAQSERDRVHEALLRRGIATGRYFCPLHRQPVVAASGPIADLPATDHVAARVLALPFFPGLKDDEVKNVVSALAEEMSQLRRRRT
jgi:perosamine synthetase